MAKDIGAVFLPPLQRAVTERDRGLFSVVFNFPLSLFGTVELLWLSRERVP